MTSYISNSEKETINIAHKFASSLKKGDVICLYGNLGVGKSVFARALIRKLTNNPEEEVPSPTFTLVQTYGDNIFHYDLYRIEDPEEIWELNWEEAISDSITLVEWPERLGYLLPNKHIRIDITQSSDMIQRIINIRAINEQKRKNR